MEEIQGKVIRLEACITQIKGSKQNNVEHSNKRSKTAKKRWKFSERYEILQK